MTFAKAATGFDGRVMEQDDAATATLGGISQISRRHCRPSTQTFASILGVESMTPAGTGKGPLGNGRLEALRN